MFLKFKVHSLIYCNPLLKVTDFITRGSLNPTKRDYFIGIRSFYITLKTLEKRILTWMCDYPLFIHSKTSFMSILDFGTSLIDFVCENLIKNHQMFSLNWFFTSLITINARYRRVGHMIDLSAIIYTSA